MKTFEEVNKDINIFMDGRLMAMDNIKFIGDIYLFGIWSGKSTALISDYLNKNKYRLMYGFDSFQGLPKETKDILKYCNFKEGAYSSENFFGMSKNEIIVYLDNYIDNSKLTFISGYYKDSLTKELAEDVKSASYIDIDCDLHSSTSQALIWMFNNKLIVKGTIIYFDDWGSTEEYKGGESLAWKEAVEKYEIKYDEIYSHTMGESTIKVMEIICVNG